MIKNIVFDVGNVLLKWDPKAVVRETFPNHGNHESIFQEIFKHQTWLDLNLGRITEAQAIDAYHIRVGIERAYLKRLLENVKHSLVPIPGSVELLRQVHQANFRVYALTDNTHEIMAFLKQKYDFWPLFHGIVISAEMNYLKPAPEIYTHLLSTYTCSRMRPSLWMIWPGMYKALKTWEFMRFSLKILSSAFWR